MATYNKDKETLVEQIAKQNAANLIVEGQPFDRNVAGLHDTGAKSVTPEGFEGSAKAVYTHNDSQGAVTDSMNKNSGLWWEAKAAGDTDWMKSLEAANQQLASLLGDGVSYNSATGTWSGVADMPATMQASMTTGVNPVKPTYDYDAWATENPAPTYQSAYNAQIDALMNQLLAREKFSYDAESDPLFQQYKNIYTREGNRSMNDTLAAAASGAGGMSSYAMTAAQQANNYYMAQLGDKIPELQQLAYSMYMDDLNLQRQDIGMLMDKDNIDYSRYRDSMSDWYNDRDFNYGQYRDQMYDYQWGTELNYGAYRDQVADDRYNTEWQHALERELIEDEWRQKEWDYGLSRDEIEDYWREKQFNYGVSQDQLANEWKERQWAYETNPDTNGDDDDLEGLFGGDGGNGGGSSDAFWGSVTSLGIGPVNANYVLEIAELGGIVENADGTLSWANGWNAGNYKQKMADARIDTGFGATGSNGDNQPTGTGDDTVQYFSMEPLWDYARKDLGISESVTDAEIAVLSKANAFVYDYDTLSYVWAPGWSADNVKTKLLTLRVGSAGESLIG